MTDTDFQEEDQFGVDNLNPFTQNYYSRFEIPAVVINEQFSQLIGISMKTKTDMTLDVNFKKSRNLSLSFTDYQLRETKTTEYVLGFAYKLKGVVLPFSGGGVKKNRGPGRKANRGRSSQKQPDPNLPQDEQEQKGSDLEISFDFSYRDDLTYNHLLDFSKSV